MRARRMQSSGPRPGGPSQSPHKRAERRPRRNSDSSLLIDIEKPLTEEEKKQRDARRREKEGRHRQQRPNKRVDVIDQLDATSIFGIGGKLSMLRLPAWCLVPSRTGTPQDPATGVFCPPEIHYTNAAFCRSVSP